MCNLHRCNFEWIKFSKEIICKKWKGSKGSEVLFSVVYENSRQNSLGISWTLFRPARCDIRARKLALAMRLVHSFFSLYAGNRWARGPEIIRKRLEGRSQLKFSYRPTDSRFGIGGVRTVPCKYVNVITGLPRGRHRRSRTIVSMSLAEELRFLVFRSGNVRYFRTLQTLPLARAQLSLTSKN